jgi:hypothetical protein
MRLHAHRTRLIRTDNGPSGGDRGALRKQDGCEVDNAFAVSSWLAVPNFKPRRTGDVSADSCAKSPEYKDRGY